MPAVRPGARVLVVDSEQEHSEFLLALLQAEGHEPLVCVDAAEAHRLLDEVVEIDLLLVNLDQGGERNWELMEFVKSHGKLRYMPVAAFTYEQDNGFAITARQRGADQVIQRPVASDELVSKILCLLRTRGMYRDLLSRRFGSPDEERGEKVRRYMAERMGGSSQVQEMAGLFENVASTDTTVLLEGESGTGKGLLAEIIHRFSRRTGGPFVVVNCAAYPETLLSSELFGHEKGSFTGAIRQKMGRFELAKGGTIFLDEVAEISPLTQLALLRVLQDRQFERVGGEETLSADVRVLAATNKPLKEMVDRDQFREDLYYRLNVVRVEVPPLRERPEDIPFLANYFLHRQAQKAAKDIFGFTQQALALLLAYPWPGNVRELRNVVEHAVLMCHQDVVEVANLPGHIVEGVLNEAGPVSAPSSRLWEQERQLIRSTLERVGWNKYRAAQVLGIARSTLYGKIKRYGLNPPGN